MPQRSGADLVGLQQGKSRAGGRVRGLDVDSISRSSCSSYSDDAATQIGQPTDVLAGLVDRGTFHNVENGFCVLRIKARGQRDLITVLGHAAMISAGEFVQASGTWVNHRTHGLQFKASFLKATAPTTIEGIEKYLGSGMIRGIGPVYAKKLVRAFGETVFDVIEQEPRRLREVTGIGPKRAELITAGWAEGDSGDHAVPAEQRVTPRPASRSS
jgi:ATP-dependent exoDNAse (exonuclease V) alpha subunit